MASRGPNFYTKAEQLQGDNSSTDQFLLSPVKTTFPEHHLPAPLVGGPKDSYIADDSLDLAEQSENGLPAEYYLSLISGGTGQTSHTPDQAHHQCELATSGPVPADERDHLQLHRLCSEPRASLLPDVAAVGLQSEAFDA